MKNFKFLPYYYLLAALFILVQVLVQTGCSGSGSPSGPSGPAPTATPTTTPVLALQGYEILRINDAGSFLYDAYVYLQLGGQPVTSAAVSLISTGAGVTEVVPYFAPVTNGAVYSYYASNAAFTYTPGQTYVVSATASGQTTSVTLAAPGGITAVQDNIGAVTEFTAGTAGNTNYIVVNCTAPVTTTYSANSGTSSSFVVPDSGVSNAYAAPGTIYNAIIEVHNDYGTATWGKYIGDHLVKPVTVLDIIWDSPSVTYSYDPSAGGSYFYYIGLNVQGTAPTSAGVTLTDISAASSLAIPYNHTYTNSGVTFANYESTSSALSYNVLDTYVLSTTTAIGTASVTLVPPGGVITQQDSTTHAVTQVSWVRAGNYSNSMSITEISPSSATSYGNSSATSPVTFLPEATYYPAGHNSVYQVIVNTLSAASSITNGILWTNPYCTIGETYTQTVTIN